MRLSAAFLIVFIPVAVFGQRVPDGSLQSVRSWKCEFETFARSEWRPGQSDPRITRKGFGFDLDNVDLAHRKARIVGGGGADDVSLIVGPDNNILHFLEVTPAGNLNVTTIFAGPLGDRFRAVHARHLELPHGPSALQAYGYCRAVD